MNLKNLLIVLAITLSPVIQAGPVKWIKDNAAPIAIAAGVSAIAGISFAVIYISQPDDADAEEITNQSPTSEQPTVADRYMLDLAKRQTAQRPSASIEIHTESHDHLADVKTRFDPKKAPLRSCIKGSRKKELEQKKQDTI